MLRTNSCSVCIKADIHSIAGTSCSCVLGRSMVARRLSTGLIPADLPGEVLTSKDCRTLARDRPISASCSTVNGVSPSLARNITPNRETVPCFHFTSNVTGGNDRSVVSIIRKHVALSRFMSRLSVSSLVRLLNKRPGANITGAFNVKGVPRCNVPSIVATSNPTKIHVTPRINVYAATFPYSALLTYA